MSFIRPPFHVLRPVLSALALSTVGLATQAEEIDYGAGKVNSMAPTPGTFLAVWRGGQARLLQRGADYAGMSAAKETVYRGLFPMVECRVDDQAVVR